MIIHETKNIVAIATKNGKNRKVGEGIQIWILDAKLHPMQSKQTGRDAKNQCKGCPFASGQGCYVFPMPLVQIHKTWKAGGYGKINPGTREWNEFFNVNFVRFGAYGNPSLLPLKMVEDIAGRAKKMAGYFHDWHLMKPEKARAYGKFFMASCEPSNREKAVELGLRTFTATNEPLPKEVAIECIADVTNKKVQCSDCGLCDGNRRSGMPHIWIKTHGYQLKKAQAAAN